MGDFALPLTALLFKMKTTLTLLFVFVIAAVHAQITMVDIVKARGEYEKEAIYFYENNWKVFREEALKAKYISGFELVKSTVDSTGFFTIVLMTHFADDATHAAVEKNFRSIMERVSPGGPKMLNSVTRKEFIVGVSSYSGRTLWRK